MKITRLRTEIVTAPLDPPIGLERVTLHSSGLVLVFLESDQGAVGEGLLFTFNGDRLGILNDMVLSLAPLIEGLDPTLSGVFATRCDAALRSYGPGGAATYARAGIESALLDLRAKLLDLNVAQLLGACRSSIPCYQSSGLWAGLAIDTLQRTAADHVAAGYRAMKMRLSGDEEADVARVRAIREAIGPEIGLLADANQRLTRPRALRLGRRLEEFDLVWFEEPLPSHDHRGEAEIAAALDVKLASGESVFTSRGVMEMLRLRSCDVLMADLLRIGGPVEFLKAASLAEGFDIPISNHVFPEMSLALLAAVPNANYLEDMPWTSQVYRETVELDTDGNAIVPDRPGWGFSFDPDAIRRYAAA